MAQYQDEFVFDPERGMSTPRATGAMFRRMYDFGLQRQDALRNQLLGVGSAIGEFGSEFMGGLRGDPVVPTNLSAQADVRRVDNMLLESPPGLPRMGAAEPVAPPIESATPAAPPPPAQERKQQVQGVGSIDYRTTPSNASGGFMQPVQQPARLTGGGGNAPTTSVASDVAAGLARSPIMAMERRMQDQEARDIESSMRRQAAEDIRQARYTSGYTPVAEAIASARNANRAQQLLRGQQAVDVGRAKAAADIASSQATAQSGLLGRMLAADAARYGAEQARMGQEARARGGIEAAQIGAQGRVGAAAAGRMPTTDQLAAQLVMSGQPEAAQELLRARQGPQQTRVTPVQPATPGEEPGAWITEPGKPPRYTTNREQIERQFVEGIDADSQMEGAEFTGPSGVRYKVILGQDGKKKVQVIR